MAWRLMLALLALAATCNAHEANAFSGLPMPYTTVEGDSLFKLAAESEVAVDMLREVNSRVTLPMDVNASLPIGLALSLPGKPAVPPLATTVDITSHVDVDAIATAYQLNVAAIKAANNMVCLSVKSTNFFITIKTCTG